MTDPHSEPSLDNQLNYIVDQAHLKLGNAKLGKESAVVLDEAITAIRQAFTNEGYSTLRDRDGMKFQTGQMFYDRFRKAYDMPNEPTDTDFDYYDRALEAAKRAAGLTTEGGEG